MSRTQRTAEIIKLDREIIIQTSELLRERSYGSFEKRHADEFKNTLKDKLKERDNQSSDDKYRSFRLAPDVETDEELMTRFINQLREISVAYPNKTVLVVTHAGCIKNFIIKTGYMERKTSPEWYFKHAGYVKVLSDGIDFLIKEVEGIKKIEGVN